MGKPEYTPLIFTYFPRASVCYFAAAAAAANWISTCRIQCGTVCCCYWKRLSFDAHFSPYLSPVEKNNCRFRQSQHFFDLHEFPFALRIQLNWGTALWMKFPSPILFLLCTFAILHDFLPNCTAASLLQSEIHQTVFLLFYHMFLLLLPATNCCYSPYFVVYLQYFSVSPYPFVAWSPIYHPARNAITLLTHSLLSYVSFPAVFSAAGIVAVLGRNPIMRMVCTRSSFTVWIFSHSLLDIHFIPTPSRFYWDESLHWELLCEA